MAITSDMGIWSGERDRSDGHPELSVMYGSADCRYLLVHKNA